MELDGKKINFINHVVDILQKPLIRRLDNLLFNLVRKDIMLEDDVFIHKFRQDDDARLLEPTSVDIDIKYIRDKRWDVISRAIQTLQISLAKKNIDPDFMDLEITMHNGYCQITVYGSNDIRPYNCILDKIKQFFDSYERE